MKQVKLILLMLVTCIAQVSMAQTDLIKKWAEAGELEKTVTKILLYAHNNDDAKMYIDMAVKNNSQYMTADEKAKHVEGWFNTIKDKLPKWDEKLSKGKNISSKDAIKAAVCYATGYNNVCQVDYAKAEKYFQMVNLGDYNKDDIDLSILGCKYMQNKDKSAALAGMNISKPSDDLSDVAEKYGIQDIYSEKAQQILKGKEQEIKRAIRSKDMNTLLSFKEYGIREVDSTLAAAGDKESIEKCLRKYQIKRFVYSFPLEDEFFLSGEFLTYPDAIFKTAFAVEDDSDNKYKMLNTLSDMLYGRCMYLGEMYDDQPKFRQKGEEDVMNLLNGFGKKNAMAGYTMTAMVQIMGLNGRFKYSRDFRVALTKALANYIKNNPKLKTYGDFNKYFTIDDNGNITLVNIPKVEYANTAEYHLLVPLYVKFAIAIIGL